MAICHSAEMVYLANDCPCEDLCNLQDRYVPKCTPWSSLQSLSLGAATSTYRPQPICDLAYNPEEIKARLSGVPVYTVANKQNEFVLVAGEVLV